MLTITLTSDETSPLSSMAGTVLRLFMLTGSENQLNTLTQILFAVNPPFFRNDHNRLMNFSKKTFVYNVEQNRDMKFI
jgi:hypothetical protein